MKKFKRSKHFVHHHITNKCRGGHSNKSNLILLEENREKAWHFIFKDKSFEEVAELLLRICKIKGRKR